MKKQMEKIATKKVKQHEKTMHGKKMMQGGTVSVPKPKKRRGAR